MRPGARTASISISTPPLGHQHFRGERQRLKGVSVFCPCFAAVHVLPRPCRRRPRRVRARRARRTARTRRGAALQLALHFSHLLLHSPHPRPHLLHVVWLVWAPLPRAQARRTPGCTSARVICACARPRIVPCPSSVAIAPPAHHSYIATTIIPPLPHVTTAPQVDAAAYRRHAAPRRPATLRRLAPYGVAGLLLACTTTPTASSLRSPVPPSPLVRRGIP